LSQDTNLYHSLYQNKDPSRSLISNNDLLYTLSLFALEPSRWVRRHEWRSLTDLELCALGTFWKSMGVAMSIDFSALTTTHPHWNTSGLTFLQALDTWAESYESATMLPSPANKTTADETTTLLLYDVPTALRPHGRLVVSALMDPRLRTAMSYESPPPWLDRTVAAALALRKYVLRYAMLPRPWAWRKRKLAEMPDANGRLFSLEYQAEPWYVQATVWNRWGVLAWIKWAGGKPVPGPEWQSEGFLTKEVGPKSVRGKGEKEFGVETERLMGLGRGGCPFG
jgi:hypothetical protein